MYEQNTAVNLDNPSLVAIVGLVATVAGFIYTWMSDARHRRWQKEDAKNNQEHMKKQDTAIENGTVKAGEAYTEANRVNMKIAELQAEIKRLVESQVKAK